MKLLDNQQKLMRLLKTRSTLYQNNVQDPIKVEFVEPTVFIKEELQDESMEQMEDSNKTLDSFRQKLKRFKVPENLYPRTEKTFPCYQCDAVFSNESKVRQHAETVHTPLDSEEDDDTITQSSSSVNSIKKRSATNVRRLSKRFTP